MAQAIQNFAFDEKLVRVVVRNDDPWFVATDVCEALGIKNASQAVKNLDEDETALCSTYTSGGERTVIAVCEAGLYRLVFSSRKPEAKRFTRWVAHEVLPSIRKTGSYSGPASANPHILPPERISDPASERMLYKLNLVREARLLFGPERGRWLWRHLGLPALPPPPPTLIDEARACLRHLLDSAADDGTPAIRDLIEAALEDDENARAALLPVGIRVYPDREVFLISNTSPQICALFERTDWSGGRHVRVLRRLPGVAAAGSQRFGGLKARGVLIPGSYLDAETVPDLALH